jgi:hypothetical protein
VIVGAAGEPSASAQSDAHRSMIDPAAGFGYVVAARPITVDDGLAVSHSGQRRRSTGTGSANGKDPTRHLDQIAVVDDLLAGIRPLRSMIVVSAARFSHGPRYSVEFAVGRADIMAAFAARSGGCAYRVKAGSRVSALHLIN